jgi:hypothetical protein
MMRDNKTFPEATYNGNAVRPEKWIVLIIRAMTC